MKVFYILVPILDIKGLMISEWYFNKPRVKSRNKRFNRSTGYIYNQDDPRSKIPTILIPFPKPEKMKLFDNNSTFIKTLHERIRLRHKK